MKNHQVGDFFYVEPGQCIWHVLQCPSWHWDMDGMVPQVVPVEAAASVHWCMVFMTFESEIGEWFDYLRLVGSSRQELSFLISSKLFEATQWIWLTAVLNSPQLDPLAVFWPVDICTSIPSDSSSIGYPEQRSWANFKSSGLRISWSVTTLREGL